MLPHLEGPEPGYIACLLVLVTQSRANAIVALSRTLSIVDGYVVEATTTFGAHRGASGERNHVLRGIPDRG